MTMTRPRLGEAASTAAQPARSLARKSETFQFADVTQETASDLSVRIAHVDTTAGSGGDVDRRVVSVLQHHANRTVHSSHAKYMLFNHSLHGSAELL